MYEIFLAVFAGLSFMPLAFLFPTCVCCGRTCGFCDGGNVTNTIQVDISAFANNGCSNCSAVAGTYVLTIGNYCSGGAGGCAWSYVHSSGLTCPFYSSQPWRVIVTIFEDLGDYFSSVTVTTCGTTCGGGFDGEYFSYNHGSTKPDCTAFSSLACAFDSVQSASGSCGFFGRGCDATGTTAYITSL